MLSCGAKDFADQQAHQNAAASRATPLKHTITAWSVTQRSTHQGLDQNKEHTISRLRFHHLCHLTLHSSLDERPSDRFLFYTLITSPARSTHARFASHPLHHRYHSRPVARSDLKRTDHLFDPEVSAPPDRFARGLALRPFERL